MTLKVDGTNGVLQAYDYQVLATGFTYTFAAGTQVLVINPAGTLATGTVTMPAAPVDGMNITISSTQQITALTINGNTGQSIVGNATALKAGGAQVFIYRLSNTTWYNQGNNAAIVSNAYVGGQGQAFTSNGTFTIPTSVTAVKITVVGGGGNGGVAAGGGGGGGGGGAAISYLTSLTSGNTLTVTVGGVGGTSSVASGTQSISTISATGGTTGSTASATGVAGGAGSAGTFNIGGGYGGYGMTYGGVGNQSGPGGSSVFASSVSNTSVGQATGTAATGYGGGGAGGTSTGGAGSGGIVVFEW